MSDHKMLTHTQRYQIEALLKAGHKQTEIAAVLSTHPNRMMTGVNNGYQFPSDERPSRIRTEIRMPMDLYDSLKYMVSDFFQTLEKVVNALDWRLTKWALTPYVMLTTLQAIKINSNRHLG